MNSNDNYKPNLVKDKAYLKNVANSIKKKAPIENIKFDLLSDVLKVLKIEENPYGYATENNLNIEKIEEMIAKSFSKVNDSSVSEELSTALSKMWDYLTEADKLEKADLIFVFGGNNPSRVEMAVDLYGKGFADKIMFTGRTPSYIETGIIEAERDKNSAVKKGVSEEKILTETESINTPQNVLNSVKIFEELNFWPEKVILVTFSYHMRRAYLTFKAVADWSPKLIRSPSVGKYDKDSYYKDQKEWAYVFNEYIKLWGARQMGHF